MGWGSPWCTIPWTCTAASSRSTPPRSAAHVSRCGCRDADGARLLRDLELDPLRERQLAAPVHGSGLTAHVRLPGIGARLAAAAAVLLATEGAADFGARGAQIDVGDTAVAAGGRQERFRVLQRSEERRVGKECRSRWWREQ